MHSVRRRLVFTLCAALLGCGVDGKPAPQGEDAKAESPPDVLGPHEEDGGETSAHHPDACEDTGAPSTDREQQDPEPQTQEAGTRPEASDAASEDEDEPAVGTSGVREDWRLYWADEFEGTTLNTDVWTPYHNTYGDGNNELQCLTPGNVSVKNGALHIVARRETVTCPNGQKREFTSGFLGTREKQVYFPRFARYEMRAKVPHMHALWPAFWLRHRDGSAWAEVDVMEYFHMQVPGRTSATLHYDQTSNVAKGTQHFEAPTAHPSGWHVWAVEMEIRGEQVCIAFFVDDSQITFHGMPAGEPYCFADAGPFARHPGEGLFDIAINMAVGGNWVGHPDGPLDTLSNGRTASENDVQETTFPAEYIVDYVRVYTRTPSVETP